jgi:hypothetical protein
MLNWMSIGAEYVECPLYSVYEKGATVCGHVPARQVAVIAPPMQHDAAGSMTVRGGGGDGGGEGGGGEGGGSESATRTTVPGAALVVYGT